MKSLADLYSGRINRVKFFYGFIAIHIIDLVFFWGSDVEWNSLLLLIVILQAIFGSVIATKRLHDFGFSGWLSLLFLIPLVGFFVGLALLFTKGDTKENTYGPVPQ